MSAFTFPVGYHALNSDLQMNFTLNRFWNWVGEDKMLEELKQYGPTLSTYDEWIRQLLVLSERAYAEDRALAGAYYLRSAEFFMPFFTDDPRRAAARQRFLDTVLAEWGVTPDQQYAVPYGDITLSAYRFTPDSPRSVLVVFGGYDSYIEEWMPMWMTLRDSGFDVIIFDGPGQGACFEAGVPMTADWHEPVGAVLDYFGVEDVTLIGLSLGGCLVMRAAAFEPRVTRVIADDAMTDFSACFARPLSGAAKELISNAARIPAKAVNQIMDHAMHHNLLAQWGVHNGEHVFGVSTPAEMLAAVRSYRTDDISHLLTQDILLMAGVGDHLVPFDQVSAQIQTLVNARSVTARIFTRAESAENHCQVGNIGLSLHVITRWIDEQIGSTA